VFLKIKRFANSSLFEMKLETFVQALERLEAKCVAQALRSEIDNSNFCAKSRNEKGVILWLNITPCRIDI
jgi:hypothetical protein